jgi:hypothetical protein
LRSTLEIVTTETPRSLAMSFIRVLIRTRIRYLVRTALGGVNFIEIETRLMPKSATANQLKGKQMRSGQLS